MISILNFEIDFLENENLFQKTGVPFFSWKHWNCIEIASFPSKTTISEASVKTEWWVQNGPVPKNGVLWVTNFFFFFENFVSFKEPLIKSLFDVPTMQMHILVLFVSARVLFDVAFSLWIKKLKRINYYSLWEGRMG